MAGEAEKPYKEGYLWLPPHGVIGQLKKTWHKRYCQLFRASKQGIERLEVYENEEETSKALSLPIITLENCIKITQDPQKNQPHVFIVVKKAVVYSFAGNSEEDMLDWISAFQSVAFKDTASRQTIEEDNDLYCSSGDAGVFSVKLVSSEASERCGLESGDYTLVVGPAELQLKRNHNVLQTWPYRFIRRYGYRSGKFTFEAGRKCASGEGSFILEHANQQEIFKCISAKMKTMKSLLSGESIICGEGQFQYALGMTARSRSPLPPSPTSTCPLPPPLRPRKPPRKHPPPPRPYDAVEVRSDAWKTLGTDSLPHNEKEFQPPTSEELKGKVFLQHASSNNYDRLQHFGSLKPRVGYETPAPPLPDRETPPARPPESARSNDHEVPDPLPPRSRDPPPNRSTEREIFPDKEIFDCDILPARSADDSHRGYGVIRKKSQPPHTVYNGLEYAVVCKPHMV